MTKVEGRRHPKSSSFGFSEWNLETQETFNDLLKGMIREGIELATAEYPCTAYFCVDLGSDGHGGPMPDDATSILVGIPVGPSDDEHAEWTFSVAEMIDAMIECYEGGEGGPIIGDAERARFALLRDSLGEQVAKLDAALSRKPKKAE